MTTAELLGKVAQKCYEITQEGRYCIDFEYDSTVSEFSVCVDLEEAGEWACIFDYPSNNMHRINEKNLLIALEKLENIDETYKELVDDGL